MKTIITILVLVAGGGPMAMTAESVAALPASAPAVVARAGEPGVQPTTQPDAQAAQSAEHAATGTTAQAPAVAEASPTAEASPSAPAIPAIPAIPATQAVAASTAAPVLLEWTTDYAEAITQARQAGRPVLVRAGAVWCKWCKELENELAAPEVQNELRRWTLIYVDVDRLPREARSLAIGPVPALRVLSSSGRLSASHDGYMEADDLRTWLQDKYAAAAPARSAGAAPVSRSASATVAELIKDLDRRDPTIRETAIRRLLLVPDQSAEPVVEALARGGLACRLAALEVLREWGGPVDGLDPWQPETIDDARLSALRAWAASPERKVTSRPAELDARQLEFVQRDLGRLLAEDISTAEADAIRERLARYGELLLPHVYAAGSQVASDRARERLTCLRYRLVASDQLVFSWPGGLERLSAMDVGTRHAAADELAGRCSSADEALLLELFSDPDGLVREIALRGLQKVGGAQASGALVRLLGDPEPNVRAAVLKQMAEAPSAKIVPQIAEYVGKEKDADLIVHAIRVLRAAKGKASAECLMTLLVHANWQVRAEAAEGLGEILSQSQATGLTTKVKKDVSEALLALLEDSDGFVVSVAIKGLRRTDMAGATEALARAAVTHPQLAPEVLGMLAEQGQNRTEIIKHLRQFCTHEQPAVRAAAIKALCQAAPNNAESEMVAALGDESGRVRVAAANALLETLQAQRPQQDDDASVHIRASGGGGLFSLFSGWGSSSRKTATQPAATRPAATQPVFVQMEDGTLQPVTVRSEDETLELADHLNAATQPTSTHPSEAIADAETATSESGAEAPTSAPEGATRAVAQTVSKSERWLEQFRSGEKRPKWMEAVIAPLEAMLAAESADERVAAAVVLVAFGRDEAALPVIREAVKQRSSLAGSAAGALPWLGWDRRAELLGFLTQSGRGSDMYPRLVQQMAIWPDPRAAAMFWQMLAESKETPEVASQIFEALGKIYFGDYSYRPSSAPAQKRRQALADARQHAESASEPQRAVALAVLVGLSRSDADKLAEKVRTDPAASPSLRRDALQIQLLCRSRQQADALAAEVLAGGESAAYPMVLQYFAEGQSSLRHLNSRGIYLYAADWADEDRAMGSEQPIRVSAPTDLDPELIRPLLDNSDPRVVAQAAYVLATLKDPAGLERLVSYWREKARQDHNTRRLVYRAVVALNDDSQTPVLEEVYRTYGKDDYWLRDFYWTIRSMTGPEILKLRKLIRDEVGMDQLR